MKASRPLAFVVLAFVVGATISQASFAFADDSSTNPFRAIWDAISELQTKTDSLQAQIDDLRELRGTTSEEPVAAASTRISEPSVALEAGSGQQGQTVIQVIARNAGPENAVGVKLSTYYQMSLFSVNFIEGAECSDQSRGIIECYLGTLDAGSEARISINATPLSLGQQAAITADISSITEDANPANNHFEITFITSEAPVVIPPVVKPPVAQPQEQTLPAEQVPAQPEQSPQEQAPAEQPSEQAPAEQQEEQASSEEQPSEEAQPPQESQQEQPAEGEQQPAEQQQSEPPAEEAPAEQPSEQAPAEQQEQQSSPPPSAEPSAPSGGEAPSSGGESSGGESPPPPPPPPPSGGEGATG
jgi:hypothetical protein